jgi:hypothetical protein
MASGSFVARYQMLDDKVGLSSSNQPINCPFWTPTTVYAAGASVINGGFIYSTVAGGTSAASPGPSPNTLVDNTVTWVLKGPSSSLCASDTVAQFELGYIADCKDIGLPGYGMGEAIYVKFTGTVNAGDFCIVDRFDFTCVQLPTAAPGAGKMSVIGVSMGNQAAGTFGWVLIRGVHDQANLTAAITVGNTVAGGGAVAGRVVTTGTASYAIDSVCVRASGVVGTGTVELYWPYCAGRT